MVMVCPQYVFNIVLSDALVTSYGAVLTDIYMRSLAVETLQEFKVMLFGQKLKVYTDQKNLTKEALGSTSDRINMWWILLEEYGREILYIKGIDNTVADTISRLDYNPELNRHAGTDKISQGTKWNNFLALLDHYKTKDGDGENSNYNHNCSQVFANNQTDDEIYTMTAAEIAEAQRSYPKWKSSLKKMIPRENSFSDHLRSRSTGT